MASDNDAEERLSASLSDRHCSGRLISRRPWRRDMVGRTAEIEGCIPNVDRVGDGPEKQGGFYGFIGPATSEC